MPIDVARRMIVSVGGSNPKNFQKYLIYIPVHYPRSCVICFEANNDFIGSGGTRVDNIAPDWIDIIWRCTAGTLDHGERMSVKMNRVLDVEGMSSKRSY